MVVLLDETRFYFDELWVRVIEQVWKKRTALRRWSRWKICFQSWLIKKKSESITRSHLLLKPVLGWTQVSRKVLSLSLTPDRCYRLLFSSTWHFLKTRLNSSYSPAPGRSCCALSPAAGKNKFRSDRWTFLRQAKNRGLYFLRRLWAISRHETSFINTEHHLHLTAAALCGALRKQLLPTEWSLTAGELRGKQALQHSDNQSCNTQTLLECLDFIHNISEEFIVLFTV